MTISFNKMVERMRERTLLLCLAQIKAANALRPQQEKNERRPRFVRPITVGMGRYHMSH